ncbi:hypothetical protein BN1211_0813 [Cyberlindnera jadinii]|uniref:Uncharacterized protein n=1 Tax=Cyberlindnera jadinii (strain ATCC 18201 / CBS 1600 / BCRC 20928 / JCM 3617 / NBRC 0987 / NRRL Y-1542) TaxID=983966 RepID=A0A0H5C084_CYBJN|nr:hypothetical protein BN1211_0813 [Cyberlindnera jadinii]
MSDFEPLTSTNIILKDYDIAHKTPKDLFEDIMKEIKTVGGLRPYRNVEYDTLKIYTHAHGSKTMNLVINFEHDDDWTLDLSSTSHLHELGVGEYFLARSLVQATNTYNVDNETEISIFNKEAYEEYKKNPVEKW